MQFGFLGISYQTADLKMREQAAFTDEKKMEFFHMAEEAGVDQCMILSTCNRSEVFYLFEETDQADQIYRLYQEMFSEADLGQYIRRGQGEETVV